MVEKARQVGCGRKGKVGPRSASQKWVVPPGRPWVGGKFILGKLLARKPPTLTWPQAAAGHSTPLPQVAPVLKERMVKKGSMMIGYQPHGTRGNFFRMIVANPALTQADMHFLLDELERLGQDLWVFSFHCRPWQPPRLHWLCVFPPCVLKTNLFRKQNGCNRLYPLTH